MIPPDVDLDALFKRLHLANARRVWRDLVQRAERESWSYRGFLALLVAEETAHRQQTRLTRLTRRAHFPFFKTIDDFNFTYQSTVRLNVLGSAAYRAIQNGFDAFFTTAATLIDDLSAAFRAGELAHALPTYTHPAVLIVEVGYLTYGTDAANMLFHVVNERHRHKRSMIFTTNKSLKAWGRVLHDEDLAHAILDRVLERGRLVRLDGPSIRTLHVNLDDAMNEESNQDNEVIRISGKSGPEFPDAQTTELIEPRKRPLDDPAPPPQATAVLRTAHRQQRQNVTGPQAVPDRRRIIAAIAEHADRPAPGSAAVALQGRNRIHEGQGFLRVVAIGAGQEARGGSAVSRPVLLRALSTEASSHQPPPGFAESCSSSIL